MDHDTDGDGAINLSTSQRPSAATTPNGDTPTYGQDQQDNDQSRTYQNYGKARRHLDTLYFTLACRSLTAVERHCPSRCLRPPSASLQTLAAAS
ncbi:hypothetical protein EAG_01428 [Camponotus floridanus]|uniref:Uncharacterized protein n=1 Tax=Camponotus floridanus TaxID=104421 RepID=E2AV13_CAMFO|nr:hypothetical protein EAG_01428 [Camponotus floridanus]